MRFFRGPSYASFDARQRPALKIPFGTMRPQMAIFTPLSLDEARELGARFGLDVVKTRGIEAGSVNTGYELGLQGRGRVFARIYEEQGFDGAERETRLCSYLADHGVPTPRPIPITSGTAEGFVTAFGGKPVAMFPWIAGDMVCQRGVTEALVASVGDALAAVHVAGLSFENSSESRFRAEDLVARVKGIRERASLPLDIAALLPELSLRLTERLAARPLSVLPLVHNDLFRDNVLFEGGTLVALLDFESASKGSPAFDLVVTMLAWCFDDALDLSLARALVRGYLGRRVMPEEEREELYDASLFAALRFLITRITDFELRPRGRGVFKDYKRFLARLRALESIGRRSFRDALDV